MTSPGNAFGNVTLPMMGREARRLQEIVDDLDTYLFPVIVGAGIPLNVISAVVFWKCRALHKVTTSQYYIACCIFDVIMLLCVLIMDLRYFSVDIFTIEGVCQIVTYLHQLSGFMSHWYVCLAMFNVWIYANCREFAIDVFTMFKTRTIIISVFIFAAVSMLYLTWASGVLIIRNFRSCAMILTAMKHVRNLWITGDVFTFIIPALFALLFAVLTVKRIIRTGRSLGGSSTLLNNRRYISNQTTLANLRSVAFSSRNDPLMWSSVFLALLFAISSLIFGIIKLRQLHLNTLIPRDALIKTITSKLYNVVYALKFFLYFGMCKHFRRSVLCKHKSHNDVNSSTLELNTNSILPTSL